MDMIKRKFFGIFFDKVRLPSSFRECVSNIAIKKTLKLFSKVVKKPVATC